MSSPISHCVPADGGASVTARPGRSAHSVDIVVLSWNRLDSTLETIESARSQRGVDARVWVVDQGSDQACLDGLRQGIAGADGVVLHELGRNYGVAGGRNRGMALGRAPYIVAIDNDAVFADERTVERAVERFEAEPGLAAIGFRIRNFYTGEDDESSWAYPRQLRSSRNQEFVTTRYCGAAHALRRSAIEETTWYDEALFFYWEEADLSYQLIQAGWRLIYLPDCVVRHKVDPEARTGWQGDRFYYLVRNAVYLDWKYFGSLWRAGTLAVGYQLKGLYNGAGRQAARALRDSGRMIRRRPADRTRRLDERSRAYIRDHDERYRGTLWDRLRNEVFERLR